MGQTIQVAIASDHAGLEVKSEIISKIREIQLESVTQIEWIDLGPTDSNSVDYPDYAQTLCRRMLESNASEIPFGILICGTAIGMSVAANRFPGIRAALVYNEEVAKITREHNDSNVLCLAARQFPKEDLLHWTRAWLETPFQEEERHVRRIQKVDREREV